MTQEHALGNFIKDRLQVRANSYSAGNMPGGYVERDVYETHRVDDRFPGLVNVALGITTLAGAGGAILTGKEVLPGLLGNITPDMNRDSILFMASVIVLWSSWKGLKHGLGYRREYVGKETVYVPGTGRYAEDERRRRGTIQQIDERSGERSRRNIQAIFREENQGSGHY